ncbi:MAG: branched-chain amino acid aminotransferase [Kiritimatiellia bacterium]
MQNIDWDKLGFSYMDTRCHIRYNWRDCNWDKGGLYDSPLMDMHVAAGCLHYGQAAFEGLKAFRCKDGKVRVFRPRENARRMAMTARRTCMPEVPEAMFLEAVERVVKANSDYIPPYGTGGSLYIRPLLIGTGVQIGIAPSQEYTFLILVIPVGAYYKGGLKPVNAVVLDDYDRAAPLGVGGIKVAGNYAASLYAHEQAKKAGFAVELYLDAREHKYVEEFATSNFVAVTKDGKYVTPRSTSILPSITNATLMDLARDMNMDVQVRPVLFEEISSFAEIGACGTAVVVTPVNQITRGEQVFKVGPENGCGPVLQKLCGTVQAIQYGESPDHHGWCCEISV